MFSCDEDGFLLVLWLGSLSAGHPPCEHSPSLVWLTELGSRARYLQTESTAWVTLCAPCLLPKHCQTLKSPKHQAIPALDECPGKQRWSFGLWSILLLKAKPVASAPALSLPSVLMIRTFSTLLKWHLLLRFGFFFCQKQVKWSFTLLIHLECSNYQ